MNFGYSTSFKTIDKGFIEQFGPTGFSSSILNFSFNVVSFQSGFLYHTIFTFVFGVGFYLIIYSLISLGYIVSIYNSQFLLVIFGFCLIYLSKTY